MTKKASQPTGRYVMCPCSNILHGLIFMQIRVKNWSKATCGCGASVFLPPEFKPDHHGLTAEFIQANYPGATCV